MQVSLRKIQVTNGIFHGIPWEHCITNLYHAVENNVGTEHDGKVEYKTIKYTTAFLSSDWLVFLLHGTKGCIMTRKYWNNYNDRPFPSFLAPLFQKESKSEIFHMKMSSACSFIFMQIKVIFIRMVSRLDSLKQRWRDLELK